MAKRKKTRAKKPKKHASPKRAAKKKRKKTRAHGPASAARPKRARAKKRKKTTRAAPRRAKRGNPPIARRWYERYLASPAGRRFAADPPALANAAYWRQPLKKRAADVAKLYRGSGRQRRAAISIARAEQRHADGPPRRRNPGLTDGQARAGYQITHWGRSGRGRVKHGGAPNPAHGTAIQLGRLVEVTYETKKGGDRAPVHYVHAFEGTRPVLAFNEGGLLVVGGEYEVTEHGIEG